ncbi:MAG: hypothetical protein ACLFTJ_02475, partial [Halothece sp.]
METINNTHHLVGHHQKGFIHPSHYQEWLESQISDEVIRANLRTIPPNDLWESGEFSEIFDYLFPDGENALHRRNDGRLT